MSVRYGPWHLWFAWYPVKTRQHGWRWLRTVERALHYPPYASSKTNTLDKQYK